MEIEYVIIIAVVTVILALCFCLAIANYGYEKFYDHLLKASKIQIEDKYIFPLDFVQEVNVTKFGGKLQVAKVPGMASDAYGGGMLYLSENTLNLNSIASYAIIAHELGHAIQDLEGRKLKRLIFMRKLIRVLGIFFWPLIIAGGVLCFFPDLRIIGIGLAAAAAFSIFLAFVLKIMTISIEKDASKKAVKLLEKVLTAKELKEAKKLLSDAKLTYWADFFRALFGWTMLTRRGNLFNK